MLLEVDVPSLVLLALGVLSYSGWCMANKFDLSLVFGYYVSHGSNVGWYALMQGG